jgi:hypothetical protein
MKVMVIAALLALASIACGKSPEQRQARDQAAGNSVGANTDAKPADPVDFRKLLALLPAPVDWQREKPMGERMTAPVSFADASVRMMKGNATITVKITDSAFNQLLVAPFASFLAGNYERETPGGYEKSVKIGEAPGLEKWDSDTKTGNLTVIVAKRFIVEIDADSIDNAKVLHDMLGKIDLEKLAALK